MNPVKLILLPNSRVRVIYNTGKEEVTKARGILMRPWGVQATLEGKKTQTRRIRFYGKPGELLYIREKCWEYGLWHCEGTQWSSNHGYCYEDPNNTIYWRKRSPIHMPREAARYWLYIEDVRQERVQDISEEDCEQEGVDMETEFAGLCINIETAPYQNSLIEGSAIKTVFSKEWDKINGNRRDKHGNRLLYSWSDNPVVYVITYHLFFQGRGVVE